MTGLISVAAAATLFGGDLDFQTRISPAQAGGMFMAAGIADFAGLLAQPVPE